MSTCQGNMPISTKVDEETRDFVDQVAENRGISRSEVLRRLLVVYHQSKEGDVECPSCDQSVRIRVDDTDLIAKEPEETPILKANSWVGKDEFRQDTADREANTEKTTEFTNVHQRISELEAIVEDQQQELEYVRSELNAQEIGDIDPLSTDESRHRIDQLHGQIEWQKDAIGEMIPRLEALTAVSDLTDQGICPDCGEGLNVEESFTDLGNPSAVTCPSCEWVLGYRL